jgi:hypothetical protein
MPLVTFQQYVTLTGDDCASEYQVSARVERAVSALEERLNGRILTAGEYTETLQVGHDARVYPHAYPVTSVPVDASYQIDPLSNAALRWVFPSDITFNWPEDIGLHGEPYWASVTYTGGYTADTLPVELGDAIVGLARSYGSQLSAQLVGATSVRLGDAAVTYGSSGLSGLDARAPGLGDTIRRYRYRRFSA